MGNQPGIIEMRPFDCQIIINVFTTLACKNTVSCVVPNTNIDFAPLNDLKIFIAIRRDDNTTDYISICRPIVDADDSRENPCPREAALCSVKPDGSVSNVFKCSLKK